jgi:hypothetical protein
MHEDLNKNPSIIERELAKLRHTKEHLKGLGVDVNLIQPNVNALNQLNTQKELNDIWQSLN